MEHISNINDMQKEKLRMESDKLDKQIRTLDARYAKDVEPLRRSYEELKATSLFLERKRFLMKEEAEMHGGMFGSCGGINKYELTGWNKGKWRRSLKPSTQRQRKINRLKDKGRQDGRIADDIDIMRKFNAMMKRPFRTPIRPRPKIMIAEKKRRRSFKLPALATVIQNDKGYGNFFSSGPIRLVLEKS